MFLCKRKDILFLAHIENIDPKESKETKKSATHKNTLRIISTQQPAITVCWHAYALSRQE